MPRKTLAALCAGLFSLPAQAQLPQLDEIVVTATRFYSDPIGRPIAAQVIEAEDIRRSAALTLSEVLGKLGGIHMRINFTGVPDMPLDLRGFGMSGDQNTLVLLNGQRLSENENVAVRLSAIPLNAIERIEIVRGSGAVLYGGGATSGVVNILTRKPVDGDPTGTVSLLGGSHGLRDARASLATGAAGWGVNLHLQSHANDNYRRNNRAELDAASGELRFGLGADFLALGFNLDEQTARLPGARTEAQLSSDRRGTSTPNDNLNSESRALSLRGEKRLGEFTLALDIGQRNKRADMYNQATWGTSRMKTEVDVTSLSPRLLWRTKFASVENRMTVGLDWSDWSYDNDTLGTGWLSSLDESGQQNNRALYFRDELSFATGTRLSLGARREHVEQKYEERRVPRSRTTSDRYLSAYELAVQQALGNGLSAYARIGRSFRVANIDENRCWFLPCPALLKPQRSKDRELGVQWQGKGASYRAGLFEMAIEDEIHYMNINPFLFGSNVNLPPTRRRGLELEGKTFFGDYIDLTVRYSHTQARFREGVYGGVDVTGKDVPLVPKDRIAINLGWRLAEATHLGFNVIHVGRQRYDNDQSNRFRKMPGYTVADIKLSHERGAWRFAAGIKNLFDEEYYSYGIVNSTHTSFNAYPEARRNAYASAEYRF